MHLLDPVAQGVHDELQGVRVANVEGITSAGVVHVVCLVVLDQPVVGGVVNPAEAQGRAQVVALSGVVVHHVQDDLDARVMVAAHHVLKLRHGTFRALGRGVFPVGGEKPQGVVSPVVLQPQVPQPVIVDELVDRHELHGRDT